MELDAETTTAPDADMHAFNFRHILPRLARVTSSEGVTFG